MIHVAVQDKPSQSVGVIALRLVSMTAVVALDYPVELVPHYRVGKSGWRGVIATGCFHFLLAPTIASAIAPGVANTFSARHLLAMRTIIVGKCSLGALSRKAANSASAGVGGFASGFGAGGFAAGLVGTTGCLVSGWVVSVLVSFINYWRARRESNPQLRLLSILTQWRSSRVAMSCDTFARCDPLASCS